MKKVIIALVAVVIIVLGVVTIGPVLTSSNWRVDAAEDVSEMYSVITPNQEASISFISQLEPTTEDYDAEIARVSENMAAIETAIENVDVLEEGSFDLTGQYAEALELQQQLVQALNDLKANAQEQVEVLEEQKQEGVSVETSETYAAVLDESSAIYTKLEESVGQL